MAYSYNYLFYIDYNTKENIKRSIFSTVYFLFFKSRFLFFASLFFILFSGFSSSVRVTGDKFYDSEYTYPEIPNSFFNSSNCYALERAVQNRSFISDVADAIVDLFSSVYDFLMKLVNQDSQIDDAQFDTIIFNCTNLINANLSESAKRKILINHLLRISNDSEFNLVSKINKKMFETINEKQNHKRYPPYEIIGTTAFYDSGLFRNTWINIISINNSFVSIHENKTYVNNNSNIYILYNIDFVIPDLRNRADCGSPFVTYFYDYNIKQYINGVEQSSIPILPHDSEVNITAKLDFYGEVIWYIPEERRVEYIQDNTTIEEVICDTSMYSFTQSGQVYDSQIVYYYDETQPLVYSFIDRLTSDHIEGHLLVYMPYIGKMTVNISNSSFLFSPSDYHIDFISSPYDFLAVKVDKNTNLSFFVSNGQAGGFGTFNISSVLNSNYNYPSDIVNKISLSTNKSYPVYVLNFVAKRNANSPLNCTAQYISPFKEENFNFDCGYSPNKKSNLTISIENQTNETFKAIFTLRSITGSPISYKKLNVEYGNLHIELYTDSEGKADISLNRTSSRLLLFAEFDTDLTYMSSSSYVIIEPVEKDFEEEFKQKLLSEYLPVGFLLFMLYYLYKKAIGMIL